MDVAESEKLKVILSVDSIRFPLTGIGRYTYELAYGLQESGLEDLRFLYRDRLQYQVPYFNNDVSFAHAAPTWKVYLKKSSVAVSAYRSISSWLKPRAFKRMKDYVFHSPNYYLPRFAGRSVVTIHDLSVYLWPQSHPPERVKYITEEIRISLQRANLLITDTEYTRHEVAAYFGWPLERIHAVPLACSSEFRPYAGPELDLTLANYGLQPQGYTLFTGTVEPRKNIGVLLDAYARLPQVDRMLWPLVIVGFRGWCSQDIHDRFELATRQGWLKYLGFVPHDVLPRLMAGARLFTYPSLYEGFGLPVLEAMACGVPVVCSNASTLPEVGAAAAAYHAPEDVDGLLALLERGLHDAAWRGAAAEAGLRRASGFSWQRCVEQTLDVYQMALAD